MANMFRMPENKIPFGPEHPFYVPEPSRWNRKMFYDSDADLVSFEPANDKIDEDRDALACFVREDDELAVSMEDMMI